MYYRIAPFLPKIISLFCFAVGLLMSGQVSAATLTLSPASGTYVVGSTISVSVLANSSDEALNAVSGALAFPKDSLEVTSISKGSSVISLWVREPSFSNEAGSVSFEGIVLNPGFKGNGGKVITISFRVKKTGTASLFYTSGEILANDGLGTSIVSSLGRASYSLTAPVVLPEQDEDPAEYIEQESVVKEISETFDQEPSQVFEIKSKTHEQNSWSASTEGVFDFVFDDSVTAIRLLVDDVPDSTPTILYQPPITEKKLSELEEGTSYLHVQYKDKNGWSDVIHYVLQIDTKSPEQVFVSETNSTLDTKTFTFMTLDTGSGVRHYEVQVNANPIETIPSLHEKTEYTVKNLVPGSYTLTVKAFDQAGNNKEQKIPFVVTGPSEKDESSLSEVFTVNIKDLLIVFLLLSIVAVMSVLVFRLHARRGMLDQLLDHKKEFESKITIARTVILLRDDFKKDIRMLERVAKKRELTKEEQKILAHYQAYVSRADDYIQHEILEQKDASVISDRSD